MKLMFISDIHGSLYWLNRVLEHVELEKPDQIILLGDYLYHGPRNPLPEQYDPAQAAERLNQYRHLITAIRGNCDAEVDQMLLQFPMMGDQVQIYDEGRRIFATHGHIRSMEHLPPLEKGDIFIQGHTHIPVAEIRDGVYLLNPGSISLPKEQWPNSYGLMESGEFKVRDFSGNILKQISLDRN